MKKIVLSLVMLLAVATLSAQNTDSKSNVKESVSDPSFIVVEQMPEFPGGEEALYQFLGSNLSYPDTAKEQNITGKVIVSFVVEKDGRITNAKVIKDIGGGCGEEALRVVNKMPRWKPGKQKGKPVRVQFSLPFVFNLE